MIAIIIMSSIFIGLFIWDIFWLTKIFEPSDKPYPITISTLPTPTF